MKNFGIVLGVCALLTQGIADTLLFKSGARLEGEIVRLTDGEITFKSDDVGEVKVKEEKVLQLITKKESVIAYQDQTQEEGVLQMTNGAYSVAGKTLDMKKVKAVNPEVEKWHGSVNFSGTAARGNTTSEKVALVADVKRRWEKDRLSGNGGYYFAQSGTDRDSKEKTEDRLVLSGQEDHFWTTKVFSYLNAKYERDGINNLRYRYQIGLGLGYQWLDGYVHEGTGKWSFNQEAGLTYIKERYGFADDDNRMAFRYAHHLSWTPRWIDKLAFTHNLEYLPDTDDWSNAYLLNADAGFTYALATDWQLMGKVEWEYNAEPGPDTKSSDFRYILGLGYKW